MSSLRPPRAPWHTFWEFYLWRNLWIIKSETLRVQGPLWVIYKSILKETVERRFWTGDRFFFRVDFESEQEFSSHGKSMNWIRDLALFSPLLSLMGLPLSNKKSLLIFTLLCKEYLCYQLHSVLQVHCEHRLRASQSTRARERWLSLSCHVQLCNPMDCSVPGLHVLHYLPEFAQTHVHWASDAIQPSHPLSSPSPRALNLSQHQSLFQ